MASHKGDRAWTHGAGRERDRRKVRGQVVARETRTWSGPSAWEGWA